jgi:hypothetical protein
MPACAVAARRCALVFWFCWSNCNGTVDYFVYFAGPLNSGRTNTLCNFFYPGFGMAASFCFASCFGRHMILSKKIRQQTMNPKIILCHLLVLTGGLFGCATKPESIDQLVAGLSATSGIYLNGFPDGSNLPPSASTEELVSEAFRVTDFDPGRVTSFRILEIRPVVVSEGVIQHLYTAILADTNLARKIVLMGYIKGEGSTTAYWWRRIYNADSPNARCY